MFVLNCCCSLPPEACATCSNSLNYSSYYPELFEKTKEHPHTLGDLKTGWICPVCGCGIAPDIKQCSCQLKVQS